jgi:hypothetical protein
MVSKEALKVMGPLVHVIRLVDNKNKTFAMSYI